MKWEPEHKKHKMRKDFVLLVLFVFRTCLRVQGLTP